MKHKQLHLILLALGTVLGALARFWNLSAAVDHMGLFIANHPATLAFVGVSILFVLIFLILSICSPGRGVDHGVLTYTTFHSSLSMAAAWLLLMGTLIESFSTGFGLEFILTFLLGLAAAICMLLLPRMRKQGNQAALPELVPVFFLLVKLVFNFKNWSTDPIILDYCDMLFSLIFSLLAFFCIAGFAFGRGRPRKTLFYASCGILFSAMAAVDGIMEGAWATTMTHLGFILWLCPVAEHLLVPHAAPPKPEPKEKGKNKSK